MQLLIVNDIDFTGHILFPTWKVNSILDYTAWQDGWGYHHKDVYRRTIKGTFTLYFTKYADLQQFVDNVELARESDGYINATVYVHNLHLMQTGRFYLTYDPQNDTAAFEEEKHNGFKVTIEEY